MARATATKPQEQTQDSTNLQPAEMLALEALPLGSIKLPDGSERPAIRIHSLSFLPGVDGHPPTFGGLMTGFADPVTGEVRGSGDSVALNLFRGTAISMARLCIESWLTPLNASDSIRADIKAEVAAMPLEDIQFWFESRKRDALLLVPRLGTDPDAPTLRLYRHADGRARFVGASSEEFGGAHRWLRAQRKLDEAAI